MSLIVRLPKWKVYLYDLAERYRIFKKINLNKINFGIRSGESWIIRNLLIRFGKGGTLNKQRAFIYHEYVKTVEENQSRCSKNEYRIAVKISKIKKLHLEDLIMELGTLRKFGKEVGWTFGDMRNLAEDELTVKIIEKIDPQKKYSEEFVAWYQTLPEELFAGKGETKTTSTTTNGDVQMDELIDAIENADSEDALVTIIENFPNIFKDQETLGNLLGEDPQKCMEAMVSMAEEFFKGESGAEGGLSAEDKAELLGMINAAADVKALKEILNTEGIKEYFPGVTAKGLIKVDTLRAKMIEALGTSAGGGDSSELETLYAEWEAMELADLKKTAKEIGVDFKPLGIKKEDLLNKMLEFAEAQLGGETATETAINPTKINEMIQAKDIDGLNKIAEELGVVLNVFEKKNPAKAGNKIIENITANAAPAPAKAKPALGAAKAAAGPKKSIFTVVTDLVAAGKKLEDIITAVTPLLKEKGVTNTISINAKVKQLFEVAELEKK